MFDTKKYTEYSKLVLKYGVNLQKGQGIELLCPTVCADFAEIFTEQAYLFGASDVNVRWENENVNRLKFKYQTKERLSVIPEWYVMSKNELVKKNYCYVAVASDNPAIYKDIPADKIATYSKAKGKALKKFSDIVMKNGIRWCVISLPTLAWAEQIFGNDKDAFSKLSDGIEKTMRLDLPNPEKAWAEHVKKLTERAKKLNSCGFEYLHFTNSLGTDLTVGLCDDNVWLPAKEKALDGVEFVANMPTEEIFTAPHKLKCDGIVYSALPLCENGHIIDGFSLTFKKGKIVDFSAKEGYDALKGIIETDKGTLRLGEVAIIDKYSPIAKTGFLFLNTLFDENASCHLAIGKGYATTVKNGDSLSKAELTKKGLNDSIEHVDFMIGTPDICVDGIKGNTFTPILKNGEWVL